MKPTLLLLAICAAAPIAYCQAPANDDPASSTPVFDGINPGAPTGTNGTYFNGTNATLTPGFTTACGNTGDKDVWFVYNATSTGPCIFNTCTPAQFTTGSFTDSVIDVYDDTGVGGTPGVRVGCDDDACNTAGLNSSTTVSVTTGLNYYVRISNWSAGSLIGTFYVSIIPTDASSATAATGEDCATTAAVLPSSTSGYSLGSTAGALSSTPTGTCASFGATDVDVWWIYVPPASGTLFLSREGGDTSTSDTFDTSGASRLGIYDGNGGCGALTNLLCTTTASNISAPVAGGGVYYIRAGSLVGTAQGAFAITWFLLLPPSNDDCATAITVVDGVNPAAGTFTNAGALDDAGYTAAACAAGAIGSKGVWFLYSASVTGNIVASTCTPSGLTAGSLTDTVVEVFDNCGATFVSIGCSDNACGNLSKAVFPATAGNLYWVRVSSKSTTLSGTFYLSMNPVPANDECVGAVPVALGLNGPFNILGATNSTPATTCAASNQDLWFLFFATDTGTLKISTCTSGFDTVLSVFDGACAGTQLACDDDDLNNLGPCATTQGLASYLEFAVVGGTSYMIRVGNFSTTTVGDVFLTLTYKFSFSMTKPTATDVEIKDFAGTPGNIFLNAITLSQGAFPNGWFYGVDIPISELILEANFGPPFFGVLDANGAFSITYGGIPFLGITFYTVAVEFSVGGIFVQKTDAVAYTI
jgi:trimeric autotransporter adhesin